MQDTRPDPDRILHQIQQQEADAAHVRGRLKIFFGYAAGVGKTYAMLEAAHAALAAGTDVVAGYIEPHTRPDTLAMLEGLEQLSPLCVEYKNVTLEVADDGPGIPDAAKEKLFEMFYTAQAKRGDGRRGLGLGLSLCRSIVEAHGGQIGVRDNNPHGTVFWFTLPASDTPSAPPQNGPAVLQKCVFSDFA